jgi:SAM-dependent methyltransferase
MEADYVAVNRDFYDANAEAYARTTANMFDQEWLDRFVSYIGPGGRILDVGCAGGRDSGWFATHGFEVEGIDISPSLIDLATKAVPGAHFAVMDLNRLEFPKSYFDGIWCSCVLLHVRRSEAPSAVVEMADRLRPGGVIYILVKEGSGEGLEEDNRYNNAVKFSSYFEVQEIHQMLDNANLDIVLISDTHQRVDNYRASERIFALARKREV